MLPILLAMILHPIGVRGAAVRNMTLEEIITRSDCVIYGRVLGNRSVWDEATKSIWTLTEIQVLEIAKGKTGSVVIVKEPGGTLGNVGHLFPGIPKFESQREVVVFLYSAGANEYRVTGLGQGYFKVKSEPATQTKIAVPAVAVREPVFSSGRQQILPQQQKAEYPQRLDNLLFRIRTAANR
jgi:hypothetical protein